MCSDISKNMKKHQPDQKVWVEFIKTPNDLGYCYLFISETKLNRNCFYGNIFQITRRVKWLNASIGHLGAYYDQQNIFRKGLARLRILVYKVYRIMKKENQFPKFMLAK